MTKNKLIDFYKSLKKEILFVNGVDKTNHYLLYKKMTDDLILYHVLGSSGARFSDDVKYYTVPMQYIDGSTYIPPFYQIVYIIGALGNKSMDFYDYDEITFGGTKSLIVYLDYFNGMNNLHVNKELADPNDSTLEDSLGQEYEAAIETLANLYIQTSINPVIFNGKLGNSSAAQLYRIAPMIIAGDILSEFVNLTQDNIGNIELDYLNKLIGDNINYSLSGILRGDLIESTV